MNHKGKRLFITGIPTGGKSYLAKLLADKVGGHCVSLDDLRKTLSNDPQYSKWTDFYLSKDEKEYLIHTSPDELWINLVSQSEGLWPALQKEIEKYASEEKPVIFECVNLLPHIARAHIPFDGVVLIGSSYKEILERNINHPRWGNTLELQELEAKIFFEIERPRYKEEGEKYGYQVFEKADDAVESCLKMLL